LPETALLLVAAVVTHLGDDVVLVLEDEASLAVVFVPVELHHQWLLIQVQLPFFCQREKGRVNRLNTLLYTLLSHTPIQPA
jgi:hypothetical protein